MANFDIKKNAESIADLFVSFFERYVELLRKPKSSFEEIFLSDTTNRNRLKTAIVFSATSILIGIAFARFVGLPGSPSEVNPETAVAVLLVWIFSAVLLHPLLKLFKAKGVLQDTIVVFLLVISSLHLVFIPVISVASHLLTDTKVTLTYDYVVYFGAKSDGKRGEWNHLRGDVGRMLEKSVDWRSGLEVEYTETFIKEKEPERNRTILPPAPKLDDIRSFSEAPINPELIKRVTASEELNSYPKRTEQPVLSSGVYGILFGIWMVYYLINAGYLAIGLAVPHKKNPYFLFSMAIIGPILAVLLLAVAFISYVFVT